MAGGLDVIVRFVADASSVQKETAKIEGTGDKLKAWAKGAAVAIGGAFLVDQLHQATDAAAELADQVGAAGVVFGKGARDVEAFAKTTANSFGIAESDALSAATTFGTFGKSAGLAGKDLAGFSTEMVGLAGDLSSLRGGKPEEAVLAIGAALRGESEPIRKYGVLLDDATLKARAMKMGLIATTTDALTPQAKVLAAQAEILAQTGDAQGDFARTSDSAANQQKKFAANMKEAQAAVGTALLPALQAVLPLVTKLAKLFAEHADVLVPLAAAIGAVVVAQWAWNAAASANPLGLIVAGIAAVVAAVVLLIQNWDKVKEVAVAVWDAILNAVQTVWNWIKDNWPTLLAILTGPIGVAVLLITKNWDTIKDGLNAAVDFMRGLWDGFVGFVRSIPGRIADALGDLANIIKRPFEDAWGYVQQVAGWIGDAFDTAIGGVKRVWNAFARGWNSVELKVPSVDIPLVGEVGGFTVGLPDIPTFAKGGIVSRATLAIIGEAGPEAVVPLNGQTFGGGNTYNIAVTVDAGTSPAKVGAAIVDNIRAYERVASKAWRT